MIELYAAYEMDQGYLTSGLFDRKIITQLMDNQFRRDLAARGLTEADIISRETIVDAEPIEWVASNGERVTNLRYCDKIIIPGDE